MDAVLVREVRFVASHHYRLPGRAPAESRASFGDQAAPHEHHWRVRVEVAGRIDPDTGFVVDLEALDTLLEEVVGGWRDADLNERIPEVRNGAMQPSTEALARWTYERLASRMPAALRLARVHVWESDELGAYYPAA